MGVRVLSLCRPFALLASLAVAGCVAAPPNKPVDVFTLYGAVLMQAAHDPLSKHAVARMLCAKLGLTDDTREFARCVMKLHGRDRALSRTRTRTPQGRGPAEPHATLCTAPGNFTLTRCFDI